MTKEIEPRIDDEGALIKKHDVLVNVNNGEVVLVIDTTNQAGVSGLAVENRYAGIGDWLDVYPDRAFHIVGNADTSIG